MIVNFAAMELYYTPQLSELHHGMEFEVNDQFVDPHEHVGDKNVWHKKIFHLNWFFTNNEMGTILGENWMRVKYLDKDDIVECGWERQQENLFTKPMKDSNRVYQLWTENLPKIFITVSTWTHSEGDLCIEAIIKNKSELKVIMNQVCS